MSDLLTRLRVELGALGIASLLVIVGCTFVYMTILRPLEIRHAQLSRAPAAVRTAADAKLIRIVAAPTGMAEFYRFFERDETPTDWLAKLYATASASGLELKSAEYRTTDARTRLERYQIALPVTGTYAQIRSFVDAALGEVPIMSLDQIVFTRRAAGEARVEANIVLTLHLLAR